VEPAQRLGDEGVVVPSRGRLQAGVDDVANPAVAEVVGVPTVLANQTSTPQLVERPRQ
jgi:hypothetical protein